MSKKLKTADNPSLPEDPIHPTDEDRLKIYTWNDGEITIDSQMHIYDEIPDEKGAALLADITAWFHELDEYKHNTEEFDIFYTQAQLYRFCRARQFNADKIKIMIQENIKWRIENEPHLLRFADLKLHCDTGKTLLRQGHDKYGRPVLILHNKYNNSTDFLSGAKLTYYMLEKSSRGLNNAAQGPSRHVVFMNLEDFSYSSQPPLEVSKQVAYALATAYPERMGLVIIYSAPWLFRAFYAAIAAVALDDRTKSKVIFIKADDKKRDEKFEFLLGPDWPTLTGIGQEQVDPKVAPGFNPEEYAEWCFQDDERRFGTRLGKEDAAKLLEEQANKKEQDELESIPSKPFPVTEVPETTTTTTTTTTTEPKTAETAPEPAPTEQPTDKTE